jgi:Flp pilus assembly protein TadD
LFTSLTSLAAAASGWLSVRHSLSLLHAYYGDVAFDAHRLAAAARLYHTAQQHWKSADTVGKEGICLLLLDRRETARGLLAEAQTMRGGSRSAFEQFFEGMYWFFREQPERARPLLEQSWAGEDFRWRSSLLLAVIHVDQGNPAKAAQCLGPFLQAAVEDYDQAYVMAALKLAAGQPAEARVLLAPYPPEKLPRFWRPRFERLRARLNPPGL